MKKDVKKLLSLNASAVLPDDGIKENIKQDLGIDKSACERAYAHGGTDNAVKKRSVAITLGAFIVAVAVFFCVLIPNLLNKGNANPDGLGKFGSITTTGDFYAYGAASVGSLISGNSTEKKSYSLGEDEKQIVNKYMSLVEELLSDGAIEHTDKEETHGDYSYVMSVKYKDLLGNEVKYVMYYNRIYLGKETDGDEIEEEYSIDGVLEIGEKQYPVEGKMQTEQEQDENESETYFKAYTSDNKNSWIEVVQESETENESGETEEEKKYYYSVYENYESVESIFVEYENEDGELSLKMVVEKPNGEKDELHFEKEEGKGSLLHVIAKINGEKKEFVIRIRTDEKGESYYEYDIE